MRHHSIVLQAKTSVAQKLPKDLESKIETFYKDVHDLREDGKYSKEMIGNIDEKMRYGLWIILVSGFLSRQR